jgi:hypothetical protein
MSNGRKVGQMRARTLFLLEEELNVGDAAIDKSEAMGRDENGLSEVTVMRLRHASGCGHVIHTAAELGGVCGGCRRSLCSECAKTNLCSACGKPACGRCRRFLRLHGMRQMVCRACFWKAWFSDPVQLVRRALFLAFLWWLLRWLF